MKNWNIPLPSGKSKLSRVEKPFRQHRSHRLSSIFISPSDLPICVEYNRTPLAAKASFQPEVNVDKKLSRGPPRTFKRSNITHCRWRAPNWPPNARAPYVLKSPPFLFGSFFLICLLARPWRSNDQKENPISPRSSRREKKVISFFLLRKGSVT